MMPKETGAKKKEGEDRGYYATHDYYASDEEAIKESLESKRLGFKETSDVALQAIFHKAPEGETFTVPEEGLIMTYKWMAEQGGRKDLKFVVGE